MIKEFSLCPIASSITQALSDNMLTAFFVFLNHLGAGFFKCSTIEFAMIIFSFFTVKYSTNTGEQKPELAAILFVGYTTLINYYQCGSNG
jgi:hypothetical protein